MSLFTVALSMRDRVSLSSIIYVNQICDLQNLNSKAAQGGGREWTHWKDSRDEGAQRLTCRHFEDGGGT